MSGFGLSGLRPLPVIDAGRVRLVNCRRGFGKLSQYGDRYAMVLEPLRLEEPLRVEAPADAGLETDGKPEALALTISLDDFARIAVREGYHAHAIESLARQAIARGTTLPRYLWSLLDEADFDRARYRRALFDRVGYTSPHYVPHPVATAGADPAVTFFAPGAEGSGSEAVVPVRVRTEMTRVLSLDEAWRLKPNASQLDYFAMCLLAEVHNLSLADLAGEAAEVGDRLHERLAAERVHERERFLTVLRLDESRYRANFRLGGRRPAFLRERDDG